MQIRTFNIISKKAGEKVGKFCISIEPTSFGDLEKIIQEGVKSGDYRKRNEITRLRDGVVKDRMNWTTETDITYEGFIKLMGQLIETVNANLYEAKKNKNRIKALDEIGKLGSRRKDKVK